VPVRILLPPSEAKRPGGRGLPLDRRAHRSELAAVREPVFAALRQLLDGADPAGALRLPPSTAEASLSDNRRVGQAPTMPAMQRYCGVVYEGLDVQSLSPAARTLAGRELLIFSGLFGVSRGRDPLPSYRVPATATLPGLGTAGSYWRHRLGELMPALLDGGLLLDLRSSDYAAMWQPAATDRHARRWLAVRVLSRRPDGTRGVLSYPSKLAKGRLAAALLERRAAGDPVRGAEDVAAIWSSIGGTDARVPAAGRGAVLELMD
jgi:hypothetical protein